MPTRFIQRRADLGGSDTSRNNANAIFVDSDDNQLKFTTGTSGTTTVDVVTESQTQTLTNKTLTAPTLTAVTITGTSTIGSGMTITAPVLSGSVTGTYTLAGTPTITAPTITAPLITTQGLTNVTTGNLTLTAAAHGGGIITINDANSANIRTLPDATGSGVTFLVIIGTTVATGTLVIAVPDASNTMVGTIISSQDYDSQTETMFFWNTVAASDTITLDGTTQGGRAGDWVRLTDIGTDKWHVYGVVQGSGTEVTPFSAAV